jgi:hypothetical protein
MNTFAGSDALALRAARFGLMVLVFAVVALVHAGVSSAALYQGFIPRGGNSSLELRTVERSPGRWYARVEDFDPTLDCDNGFQDYAIWQRGDLRPVAVPLRGGRFQGTLRQVDFGLDPFVRSGTLAIEGRFGPRRPRWRRTARVKITAHRVGEGGTVCSARFSLLLRRVVE